MFHILVYGGPLDMSIKHDRKQNEQFIVADRCVYRGGFVYIYILLLTISYLSKQILQ